MFKLILAICSFISVMVLTLVFGKKPLRERDIEGGQSLLFRVVGGFVLGIVAAFLISF